MFWPVKFLMATSSSCGSRIATGAGASPGGAGGAAVVPLIAVSTWSTAPPRESCERRHDIRATCEKSHTRIVTSDL
eukprot:1196420-Prorocentrum_minimum.AAC.8